MVTEDFSFPKITNPIPHFTFTPSLWRVSSVVYPDFCDEIDFSRKSFSCLESERDRENEEKMDMLWEDFNEELQRVSSLGNRKDVSSGGLNSEPSREMVELCCVRAMKMSKTGSGMIYHHKRPGNSMGVLKKVLKKIFLLQNLAQIKKK